MENLNFNLDAFSAIKNGQKIQTSTPILDAKGHINKFGLNRAAMDLMGVDDRSNITILSNNRADLGLGERYIAVITHRKTRDKDEAMVGARIMVKANDSSQSGAFQYAVVWAGIQANTVETLSIEELFLQGVVIEHNSKKRTATKNVNFTVVPVKENVPYSALGGEFANLEGTCTIFALTEPVEEAYVYNQLSPRKATLKDAPVDTIGMDDEDEDEVNVNIISMDDEDEDEDDDDYNIEG